ncbi:MAG: M20/M25/M40 family metallo-hydrolase, partial [Candidatus Methylomirabilis sp.]|nr:M20/M25/M40 family metallo-hydrolase [Deltaproteobacteria bacterium]
ASYGEEIGLVGARRLAEDRPPRARYAVVTEPTELEVVHAHKGLAAFEAVLSGPAGRLRTSGGTGWLTRVEGVSAHASTPRLGENALWRLFEAWPEQDPETAVYRVRGGLGLNVVPAEAEILTDGHLALERSSSNAVPIQGLRPMSGGLFAAMIELSDGLRALPSQWGEEAIFDPPGVTHNLGVADADADRAVLRFEYRLIPGVRRTEMLDALQALALDIAVKHAAVRVDVRCTRWTDPMAADPDGALARVAREELRGMGLPGTLATKAGCTEAAVYAGLGMETIVFGAGRAIGNIHKPNERTSVAALQHAAEFYRRLYRRLLM